MTEKTSKDLKIKSYRSEFDNTRRDKQGRTIAGYRLIVTLEDGGEAVKFVNSRELAAFEAVHGNKRQGIKWV